MVVAARDTRVYYQSKDAGNVPPDCSSLDGSTGVGKPGGACADVPAGAVGLAARTAAQACKQVKQLFMLRGASMLPEVVSLPPTSLKAVRQFFLKLATQGIQYHHCILRIELEKAQNAQGKVYGKAVMKFVRKLSPDEIARAEEMRAFAEGFSDARHAWRSRRIRRLDVPRNHSPDQQRSDGRRNERRARTGRRRRAATGKSGSITLTIKVAPASKNATDVLMVESQVKTKLPEPERGMTIFYATEDNRLVRNDPKQQMLPLRVVDIEQQPQATQGGGVNGRDYYGNTSTDPTQLGDVQAAVAAGAALGDPRSAGRGREAPACSRWCRRTTGSSRWRSTCRARCGRQNVQSARHGLVHRVRERLQAARA